MAPSLDFPHFVRSLRIVCQKTPFFFLFFCLHLFPILINIHHSKCYFFGGEKLRATNFQKKWIESPRRESVWFFLWVFRFCFFSEGGATAKKKKILSKENTRRNENNFAFFCCRMKSFSLKFSPDKAEKKRVEATLIKMFLCAFKFCIMSLFFFLFLRWNFADFCIHFQACSRYGLRRFVVQICSTSNNISTHRLRHNRQINFSSWKVH